jgi:hypothetical protein
VSETTLPRLRPKLKVELHRNRSPRSTGTTVTAASAPRLRISPALIVREV